MKNFLKFDFVTLASVILFCIVLLSPAAIYAQDSDDKDIHYLQRILTLKGMYAGPIDGISGPETNNAIRLYKKQIGWPVTNQISDQLIERLREEEKSILPNTNHKPDQSNNQNYLIDPTPTTRDMIYSVVQSAKMATNTADSVMQNYESYFATISRIAGGLLALFALLGTAGFWAYLKPILKIKKEYGNIIKQIQEQQKNIIELKESAHADIAASSTASSANASLTMFICFKDTGLLSGEALQNFLNEADLHCRRALDRNPRDNKVLAWIYGMQGVIFWEQNKKEQSCEVLKKSLEIDPDNANTLYNTACHFSMAGRKEEALDYVLRAFEIKPNLKEWAKTDSMLVNIRNDPRFPIN